ncbi:MAG TPA: sensor domain-containing diguanylate cyclase, partial [Candidatus Deferrimicrobiaceae bacterium]|nr:sensor domain-containing diguanylate cyclase [Candidatus Deferrimicrobiaceae bacterium]
RENMDGPLEPRIHWRIPFSAVLLGVGACTLLAGVLISARFESTRALLLTAVLGLLAAGAGCYLFLEHKVFRPAERWGRNVAAAGTGPIPLDAGVLSPLAAVVSERYARTLSELEEGIKEREEKLRQVELLRRDLEETTVHLESKIQDLRTIYEVSTTIAGTLDSEELFRILPERVMSTLGVNDFSVLLYSPETRMLTCRAGAGMASDLAGNLRIAPGEGVAGRVFETGDPVYLPDTRSSSDLPYSGSGKMDIRSFVCVPLLSKGKAIGVLNVHHSSPNAFDAESIATMRVLATYLASAIENADLFRFVKTLAEKDSLTLLYNHGAFHEKLQIELERAARYGRALSVIMLDLDGFKEINDAYGHLVGDRILLMTAGVLCAHLRKSDIAARYGGDEFAVILPETGLEAATTIASRIASGISAVRMDTGKGEAITFTASLGYAACLPDSPGRETILNVADRLMYESKRRGRGGVLGEKL